MIVWGDNKEMNDDSGVIKQQESSFSVMIDSLVILKSMMNNSSSSSRIRDVEKPSKFEVNWGDDGSIITVKTTC